VSHIGACGCLAPNIPSPVRGEEFFLLPPRTIFHIHSAPKIALSRLNPDFHIGFDRMVDRASRHSPLAGQRLDRRPSRPVSRLRAEFLGQVMGAGPFCEVPGPLRAAASSARMAPSLLACDSGLLGSRLLRGLGLPTCAGHAPSSSVGLAFGSSPSFTPGSSVGPVLGSRLIQGHVLLTCAGPVPGSSVGPVLGSRLMQGHVSPMCAGPAPGSSVGPVFGSRLLQGHVLPMCAGPALGSIVGPGLQFSTSAGPCFAYMRRPCAGLQCGPGVRFSTSTGP